MVLPGAEVNDHIIYVSHHILMVGLQNNIHECLESRWGLMEYKRENPILPIVTGSAKGSVWPDVGCEGHLPVALCQVQCGDEPGDEPQPLDEVIHWTEGQRLL